MLRKMLQLTARAGHPGARLTVGDSDGRRLYLAACTPPIEVVIGLERDQVRQLAAVCTSWLAERDGGRPLSAQTAAARASTVQV